MFRMNGHDFVPDKSSVPPSMEAMS